MVGTARDDGPHPSIGRYGLAGIGTAVVFAWVSLTPTLLPRGPLFQGVVSGAAAAVGYGLGVLLGLALTRLLSRRFDFERVRRIGWFALAGVTIVGSVPLLIWFGSWQRELRSLMGAAQLPWFGYPLMLLVAIAVFIGFVALARLWWRSTRWVARQLGRVVPPAVSTVVAVVLVAVVTIGIVEGPLARVLHSAADSTFETLNREHDADSPTPAVAERSGGPGSLVSWDSLGRQGRIFVADGPTVSDLAKFTGREAQQPIRAYVGLPSADDVQAEAALAVRELERAGGFQRAVLGVATTTGSGWINDSSASALEYMYGGNSALVSMQYSYLPSWISFLADQKRARSAGRELFDAVYARWRLLPPQNRPKLVVFGESLGSFGGEAAFDSAAEMAAKTDGVLFVGPPDGNELWGRFTAERDAGSPQWLPVYEDGRTVRFVSRPPDAGRPDTPWPSSRVVYLQHASDPITWWNPALLFQRPDWLRERRGYDVLDSVRWFPVVTFLQVSADMAVSNGVPDGHGHIFVADIANAWAAVLQPPEWSPSDTERLREVLRANAAD